MAYHFKVHAFLFTFRKRKIIWLKISISVFNNYSSTNWANSFTSPLSWRSGETPKPTRYLRTLWHKTKLFQLRNFLYALKVFPRRIIPGPSRPQNNKQDNYAYPAFSRRTKSVIIMIRQRGAPTVCLGLSGVQLGGSAFGKLARFAATLRHAALPKVPLSFEQMDTRGV